MTEQLEVAEGLHALWRATPRWRWFRRWRLSNRWLTAVGELEREEIAAAQRRLNTALDEGRP